MKKLASLPLLAALCFAYGSTFAADAKPADTKAPTPVASAPSPAASPAKASADEPTVKKSKASICHDKTSPGYKQTKNFTAFNSMDECIKSGGRAPKGNK